MVTRALGVSVRLEEVIEESEFGTVRGQVLIGEVVVFSVDMQYMAWSLDDSNYQDVVVNEVLGAFARKLGG